MDEARPTIARVWYAAAGSIAKKIRTFALFRPASTRTIIRIIPVYLVILVIVEFHTLNDMITEPDTDIGVRLYIAWRCRRTSADIDPPYRAKAGRKIDLVGRSALNPGPAETLSAAVECVFRGKSATDSGMKSATDSDLISAIPM